MIVRRATAQDIPRVVQMAQRFIEGSTYGQLLAPFDAERVTALAQLVLDQGAIFLADVDGRLDGMLAVVALEHPFTGERYGEELAWWVEPEHRDASVGPRLLRALERWALDSELSFVKMVAPAGTDVGEYYQRQGYAPIETAFLKRLR